MQHWNFRFPVRLTTSRSAPPGATKIEDIRIAFRGDVWDAGALVKERDNAATEFCDFRGGVNFPASVGRDEGVSDVDECEIESLFVHVIVVPTATLRSPGM